jgi:hypothetical protein
VTIPYKIRIGRGRRGTYPGDILQMLESANGLLRELVQEVHGFRLAALPPSDARHDALKPLNRGTVAKGHQ